jgi:hypothetical protein
MLFQTFTQVAHHFSHHIRIHEFQSLINERTRDFVGREFIFAAIDTLLHDPAFRSGYIVIRGEPGIGKTALIAQLVKRHGYLHHFNIASQNIRSPHDFLDNTCAQLIVRYHLDHALIPPQATQDSGFLSQLLQEATAKEPAQPIVVLVDALDEADDLGLTPGANRLYLPATLPAGVFLIVTMREAHDIRLVIDQRRDIFLRDDDPRNLDDVYRYIRHVITAHHVEMAAQIAAWGVAEEEFVTILAQKSQGNFMYLVYVLGDIRIGRMTKATIDDIRKLPEGLRAYYQRHWRLMKAHDSERFETYYEPVVCMLATVREPVTIRQLVEWTKLSPLRIKEVLAAWREFLNEEVSAQGESLYRVYHASFQDFLEEEVGLTNYHNIIAQTALRKIDW